MTRFPLADREEVRMLVAAYSRRVVSLCDRRGHAGESLSDDDRRMIGRWERRAKQLSMLCGLDADAALAAALGD